MAERVKRVCDLRRAGHQGPVRRYVVANPDLGEVTIDLCDGHMPTTTMGDVYSHGRAAPQPGPGRAGPKNSLARFMRLPGGEEPGGG